MAWSIWDDRRFNFGYPSVQCSACGMGVSHWVEFTRNDRHFILCEECLTEAAKEAAERFIKHTG